MTTTWKEIKEKSKLYQEMKEAGLTEKEIDQSRWKENFGGFSMFSNNLINEIIKKCENFYTSGRMVVMFYLMAKQFRFGYNWVDYEPGELRDKLNSNFDRSIKWLIEHDIVLVKRGQVDTRKIFAWRLNTLYDTWQLD